MAMFLHITIDMDMITDTDMDTGIVMDTEMDMGNELSTGYRRCISVKMLSLHLAH